VGKKDKRFKAHNSASNQVKYLVDSSAIDQWKLALNSSCKVVKFPNNCRFQVHERSILDNFCAGAASLSLYNQTTPAPYFIYRFNRPVEEALWEDWCRLGHDFYTVIVNHPADQFSAESPTESEEYSSNSR
jgi:hypothetical protein